MRHFTLLLLVLFITGCSVVAPKIDDEELPVCDVLVQSPPVYTVGDHTPVAVREIGDIGDDRETIDSAIDDPDNSHHVVAAVERDMVGIHVVLPSGQIHSMFVLKPVSQQVVYPNDDLVVTTTIHFPLCEGDTFQKTYHSKYFKDMVHQCGPVKRDSKSGYIFFSCSGPSPITEIRSVRVNTSLTETYVYTQDFKWEVIPALGTLYIQADLSAENK